jgi:hypothetical protein
VGLPTGGATNTVLYKTGSANYATAWSNVTNAMLSTTAGEIGGAWVTYAPSVTNITVATSSFDAAYLQVGKTVYFRIQYTMTANPTAVGLIQFSLPVAAVNDINPGTATAVFLDSSAGGNGVFSASVVFAAGPPTRVVLRAVNSAGTYAVGTTPSLTIPFAWASGDNIRIAGVYQAA